MSGSKDSLVTAARLTQMDGMMQTMKMMALMKDMFIQPPAPPVNPMKDFLSMASGLKDLGVPLGGLGDGGGEESDGNFMSFLTGAMPLLEKITAGAVDNSLNETKGKAEMFEKMKAKAKAAKANMNPEKAQMVGAIKMLLTAAAKDKPVELYSELVVDQVPNLVLQAIYKATEIVPLLVQVAPQYKDAFNKYEGWFKALSRRHQRIDR